MYLKPPLTIILFDYSYGTYNYPQQGGYPNQYYLPYPQNPAISQNTTQVVTTTTTTVYSTSSVMTSTPVVGMISHKMSLITIFGHKHFKQKFHQKFDIFTKKFQQPLILVHIWYQISNFEAKLLQK